MWKMWINRIQTVIFYQLNFQDKYKIIIQIFRNLV